MTPEERAKTIGRNIEWRPYDCNHEPDLIELQQLIAQAIKEAINEERAACIRYLEWFSEDMIAMIAAVEPDKQAATKENAKHYIHHIEVIRKGDHRKWQ